MRAFFLALLLAIGMLSSTGASATEAGWALLREGGHVVLLRHAYAPGPAGENDIEDCGDRHRGISERGRQQARRMGALFDTRAEPVERVLSGRSCRCVQTTEIAFRDEKGELVPFLDLPRDDAEREANRAAIMKEITGFSGQGNMVLVTHLEVIRALTGQSPREGEALIVQPRGDDLHVLGRIVFN